MAGSNRQPDRLANQYSVVGGVKQPMKPLEQVLRELREGVAPGQALEPRQHKGTRVRLYAAQRSAVEYTHAEASCE